MARCMQKICSVSPQRTPVAITCSIICKEHAHNIRLCKMQDLATHPASWTAIATAIAFL